MRSMGERYAKVVGIIVLALAIAATLLFLLFLAATVQIAVRDGAGEAAGPAFAVLCVGGCAAVCWWRGLWCLAQVRQGMPLARYRLGSDARAVVVEPLTPAECPAGGPFKPGLFLYSDSYRPDDKLTGFDIVHNEVHAIDTEGISPVTEDRAVPARLRLQSRAREQRARAASLLQGAIRRGGIVRAARGSRLAPARARARLAGRRPAPGRRLHAVHAGERLSPGRCAGQAQGALRAGMR